MRAPRSRSRGAARRVAGLLVVLVLVFTLAHTPAPELHCEFRAWLRERLDRARWQLRVVLETATYRQRVGSDDRVRERRATWDRLLRELDLTAIELP